MHSIKKELLKLITTCSIKDPDRRYIFVDENGVPKAYPRRLGEHLYTTGGAEAMSDTMNELIIAVQKRIDAGEDWLLFDLRQLEFCWNGIGSWLA